MSGDPDNLVLTYLRRIDTKVDGLRADMVEVKQRIGFLEEQYASISMPPSPAASIAWTAPSSVSRWASIL